MASSYSEGSPSENSFTRSRRITRFAWVLVAETNDGLSGSVSVELGSGFSISDIL